MDQEVQDARAKLAAKYGKGTQLGGKGNSNRSAHRLIHLHHSICWLACSFFVKGTQRRAKRAVQTTAQTTNSEDKKVKAAIKKFSKCPHLYARFLTYTNFLWP